ncbi:MAG: efflux transporter outer membrane subunit [Deltaproteobacteria bacterium]|nr:efflux transporter outer membrane subunit [Deltaproteobacteria bacterium]
MNGSVIFRRLAPLALAAFLHLVGCVKVGPDYVRPPVSLADRWLEAGDRRLNTAPAEHRDWWKVFQDPVLDRLVEDAYTQNLTLQAAGVRVLEARAQLGVATGALYPQTQQAFGYLEKNRLSGRAPEAVHNPNLGYAVSEIGVRAAWELDFWGKYRRAVESADASLLAAVSDYDAALVSLLGDVAASYIAILTLEKRLAIARQNVETQKGNLDLATARFQSGATSQRDVEQARTVLLNTQAAIPTLETQVRQAKHALSVLLGKPPETLGGLLKGSGEIPAPPPQVAVGIPADLLRRRPDVRSAEFRAMAQCAGIGVAKADLLPAFSLSGAFGFQAGDVGNFKLADMFQWRARTGSAGPSVTWNILNYGRLANLVRVQDARFQELLLAYQHTVLQSQKEVEDGLVAFLKSQERAALLAEGVQAAKRSLELAVLQYREGITDFTTVLTAQQALLSEQDSLAVTLGDISRSLVGVYRALGGGWQLREGRDFVSPSVKAEMARRTRWGRLLSPEAYPPAETEQPGPSVRPPDW